MRNRAKVLGISLIVAGTAVDTLILAGTIWVAHAIWLLRIAGLPGPIDIGFGIP